MSERNSYKGFFCGQTEFDHVYACWANNHNGWAKAKKMNKRLAKQRERRCVRDRIRNYDEEV